MENGGSVRKQERKRKRKIQRNGCVLHGEGEQEEEQQEEELSSASGLKLHGGLHSYGVQPLGNLLLLQGPPHNIRDSGLGTLRLLSDETLCDILGLLGAQDLGRLALVSKAFYVFAHQDSLWRNLSLEKLKGEFCFKGCWKMTYVAASRPSTCSAHVPLKVDGFFSDYLFQSWLCASLEMREEWLNRENIDRRSNLSVEEFIRDYEEQNKPVIITDALVDWAAMTKWDREYLIEVAGDVGFSVGPVEMTLNNYFLYADSVKEERPLYLFDPKFGEKVAGLATDYEVPKYFKEDLFSILGKDRPDYRWLIIGPARSGSSFHIDPNSTSAWNAVVRGSKKWVLFPPDVVPPGVHPSADGAEVAAPVSIAEWFMNFYAETRRWRKRPLECICGQGETMFIPNGWWHLVINLEDSIAITQNYVSRCNLLNVLDFLKGPNSLQLVSGTKDRVMLHEKFRRTYEKLFPGSIQEIQQKADEKAKQRKISFWDSIADTKSGGFKFGF